jgi:hypothetical protein
VSTLDNLQLQLSNLQAQPSLLQWQPELSGDIDIHINHRGEWYHEGGKIQREELVKLFLSILRREDDGEFYLVTPVEKWRIQVDDAPLMATEIDVIAANTPQQAIRFTLSNGDQQQLSKAMPLRIEHNRETGEPSPYIDLPNGLFAKLTRSAFYHLTDKAEIKGKEMGVRSNGQWMVIGSTEE